MAAVTFSEAARICGHKSRSSLYRLRDDGRLADYLRPGGKGGALLLETHPPGRPSLVDWVEGVTGPQSPVVMRSAADLQQRRRDLEQRRQWEAVAAGLGDALEAEGLDLQLTRQEAQAIAAALPAVLAEVMGPEGLQLLADAIATAQGPPLEQQAAAGDPLAFWSEWGRVAGADEPPLSDEEFWEQVATMLAALVPSVTLTGDMAAEVNYQLGELVADVEAGARWDQARWDAADVRLLLADLPCELAAAELRKLLEAGKVPADLLAEVEAALSAA
jgi:hypothetical protein